MTDAELKPCPFCGETLDVDIGGFYHPDSDTCPLDSLYIETRVLAAWNRRSDLCASGQQVRAKIEAVDASETAREAHQADLTIADAQQAPEAAQDSVREAAALILSQPKAPDSPIAQPFRIACGYLSDEEGGAETTNEIIETFLRALAGKGGA